MQLKEYGKISDSVTPEELEELIGMMEIRIEENKEKRENRKEQRGDRIVDGSKSVGDTINEQIKVRRENKKQDRLEKNMEIKRKKLGIIGATGRRASSSIDAELAADAILDIFS